MIRSTNVIYSRRVAAVSMVSSNSDTFSRVLTFPIWYGLIVSIDLSFLHCRTSTTLLIYEWQLEYFFVDEIVSKEMRILQIFMAVKDNVSILASVITSLLNYCLLLHLENRERYSYRKRYFLVSFCSKRLYRDFKDTMQIANITSYNKRSMEYRCFNIFHTNII